MTTSHCIITLNIFISKQSLQQHTHHCAIIVLNSINLGRSLRLIVKPKQMFFQRTRLEHRFYIFLYHSKENAQLYTEFLQLSFMKIQSVLLQYNCITPPTSLPAVPHASPHMEHHSSTDCIFMMESYKNSTQTIKSYRGAPHHWRQQEHQQRQQQGHQQCTGTNNTTTITTAPQELSPPGLPPVEEA